MNGLAELYQEVILDHNRKPRNFGELEAASHTARGDNPFCGDRIELALTVRDGRIESIAFRGSGCAISTASASMMTEAVKGRPVAEAEAMFERFHRRMTTEGDPENESRTLEQLGSLAALTGVREYPMRVKCATLAWHTLKSALAAGEGDPAAPVTTETPS